MEQRQEWLAQVAVQGNTHSKSTAVTPATASPQTTRCPRHLWMRLQLKSNKSDGSDGLVAELLKIESERLTVEMHQLIVKDWEQEELPKEWKLSVIQVSRETEEQTD